MSWILACDHRLGDTCQLLPPRGPLSGGLDVAQSSPRSFLGSCYPDRRSMGSSANVPRTVLFAHFHCVDCEKGSWAAARWQRDPTLCTTLTSPSQPPRPTSYSLLELGSVTHPSLLLHRAHKSNSYLQLQQDKKLPFFAVNFHLLHPKLQWMLIFYWFPIWGPITYDKAGRATQLKRCEIPL